ncbi:hypothetical protein [Nocardia sp. NPDC005366]|uniref:hypothetical protein n=1 Tax=Nocardia sp. NPDC005366 TaxID=3156878 RepID=UPI0033BC7D8F
MSYVQYTKCVAKDDKTYPAWAPSPTTTLILLSIPVLLASLALPYLAAVEVPLLIVYCRWWLYDRLICLGGDACAIGLLGVVEPPTEKSGFDSFDTDYSINLVLAPHNIQELPPGYPASVPPPDSAEDATEYYEKEFKKALHRQIADDGIQGHLIKEQSTTKDAGWDFLGSFNKVVGSTVVYHHQPYLHCEFEGGGMYKLLQALKVLLPLAVAAAVICAIPVIGWVACAVAAAIIAVISVVGIVLALNDTGSPSILDPETGKTTDELHPGSDILFVAGTWVYDSAHEGWNEIHPIKKCLRMGKVRYAADDVIDWDDAIAGFMVATGRWHFDPTDSTHQHVVKDSGPATGQDFRDWVAFTCDRVSAAASPLTIDNQTRPEHGWLIHPQIDGCRSETHSPPPIGPH